MCRYALLAGMGTLCGKRAERPARSVLPLARAEAGTRSWHALGLGPGGLGIDDSFDDASGCQTDLNTPAAAAPMAGAEQLPSQPPRTEQLSIPAAKQPTEPRSIQYSRTDRPPAIWPIHPTNSTQPFPPNQETPTWQYSPAPTATTASRPM